MQPSSSTVPQGAPERRENFNPFTFFRLRFDRTIFPHQLRRVPGLKFSVAQTYAVIAQYAGFENNVFPSIQSIAAKRGLCYRQITRHLRILERLNLIRTQKTWIDSKYTTNSFFFLWHESFRNPENVRREGPKMSHRKSIQFKALGTSDSDVHPRFAKREAAVAEPAVGEVSAEESKRLLEEAQQSISHDADDVISPQNAIHIHGVACNVAGERLGISDWRTLVNTAKRRAEHLYASQKPRCWRWWEVTLAKDALRMVEMRRAAAETAA